MSKNEQVKVNEIDLSDRLRFLMRDHGLTVSGLAAAAGVSKSAMEKYLAGPSSPRATAIYSICEELGVNAHWLLFGLPDEDLRIIKTAVEDVLDNLLNELKQGGEIAEPFTSNEFGTREWRMFTFELTNQRAREAVNLVIHGREKALEQFKQGMRFASIDPIPLYQKDK